MSKSERNLASALMLAWLIITVLTPFIHLAEATAIFNESFETGNFSAWTGYSGATVSRTYAHQGTYSCKITANNQYCYKNFTAISICYMRFYAYFASLPSSGQTAILSDMWATTNYDPRVIVKNNSGQMQWGLRSLDDGSITYVSATITTGRWYCIEYKYSANSEQRLYVDGNSVINFADNNLDTISQGYIGWTAAGTGITWYADSVVIDSSYTGTEGSSISVGTNVNTNTTSVGKSCLFYSDWSTTGSNLSMWIFGTNNTGTWKNETTFTSFPMDQTYGWTNITKTLNSTVGVRIEWRIWSNNSANDWEDTGVKYLMTTEVTYGSITLGSHVGVTAIQKSASCTFYTDWSCTDSTLNQYIFGCNVTGGALTNDTASSFTAGQTYGWSNATKTLPSDGTVQWQYWAVNSVGNWSTTGLQSLTVLSAPAWDFEDHTYHHVDLTTLSTTQIISEITTMNSAFEAHGLPLPVHLSYPYGGYNTAVIDAVSSYRLSCRTTGTQDDPDTYPISPDTWYRMDAKNIASDTTYDHVKSLIDRAITIKGLLNLFTHDVREQPNQYGTTPEVLEQVLDYLVVQQNAGNLAVMTIRQAYTDYNGQRAVVVLSFDDNWGTDYTTVWPMFAARGLAGTSYICGHGPDSGNPGSLTWGMIEEMAQLQPPPASYSITVTQSTHGTISPGTASYPGGISLDEVVTPDSGYRIESITVDGTPVSVTSSSGQTVRFNNIQQDHSITATFAIRTFTVTVTQGSNGVIAPSTTSVDYGGNQSFTITPNAGYRVVDVVVDGVSQGAVASWDFTGVTADHTLTASFVDNVSPHTTAVATGTSGTNGWYISSTEVDLTASDQFPGSGVKEIHYKLDSGAEQIAPGSTVSITVSADGIHTLLYWAVDNDGNVEPQSALEIKIDTVAPVVTITTPLDGAYYRSADVPLSAYSVVDANPITAVESGYSTSEGVHTYTVTAADAAGNLGSASVTYTVDNTAPVVTIAAPVDGAHYVSSTVPTTTFSVTDTNPTSVVESGYSTTEGTHTYTVTATDAAGNVGFASVTYTVDYVITVIQGAHGTISPGTTSVPPHGSQRFTITPEPGYHVVDVLVDGVSQGPITSRDFTDVQSDHSITATFTQDEYTLTVHKVGSGSVVTNPDQGTYHYGDVVQLTASPSAGWSFSGWSGALSGLANPADLTITSDLTVTATFTQDQYALTMYTIGQGSVVPGNQTFASDTVVDIKSINALGWTFAGWSGGASGLANTTVTMNGPVVVTATFTQDHYALTITVVGQGSVTKNPDQMTYTYGTEVTLTAATAIGWHFNGWSGDVSGTDNSVIVTMNGNRAVTGTFVQDQYILTISVVGNGQVNKNPERATYTHGSSVELRADPDSGWAFSYWTGDLTGHETPVTIIIAGDTSITAYFYQNEYSLTLSIIGNGQVARNPDQGTYTYGTDVGLTATADPGWAFAGWSGDASGTDPSVTVIMNGNMAVTATFTQNVYTLTVSTAGSGSANLNNNGPYYYGDIVELTAVPSTGWSFAHWGDDLSGSINPTTILIDGDKAVTATFTQNVYTLTVTAAGSGSVGLSNSGPYHYGDVVELTAAPAVGWSFSGWSGALSGSVNPADLTITDNMAVTATFTQNTYALTVATVGSGSVNLNNAGPYHYGDIVELIANPAVGWSFNHWNGDLAGSANPATILIDGNKAVTATFTQNTYTLTISTVGSGSVNMDDAGPYHYGDVVELTAVPALGWSFQSWSGDLLGSANPATIVINGNKAVTATFIQNAYTLTVTIVGSGSISKVLDQASYHYGDVVQLTANPAVGWSFSGWSGDLSGSTNPTTVAIDGNKDVTATFTQDQYTLTVNVVGAGSLVTKSPDQATYVYGTSVQLTPMAASGWSFSSWSGDLTGSTVPGTISMTDSRTVTATFTRIVYTLTISTSGSGSVSTDKSAPYYYGDVVQLTAVPAVGWSFSGWSGDISGSQNPASITMDGHESVTATFTQIEYTLTVSASPVDGGSVSKNPDKTTYHLNDVVLLTASPTSGYSFDHWSSGLNGNPTSVTITGDTVVTAYFTLSEYTLTVSASSTEGGSVSKNPDLAHYHYNDVVQLTAISSAGYSFAGWSGGLSGNPTSVTITGNIEVTAYFTQNEYSLAVTVAPDGSGSVSKSPDKSTYHYNDIVQLTAVPKAGWSFSSWSGALPGSTNPGSLTITENMTVTATFAQNTYTITINVVGQGSVSKNPNQETYTYGTEVQVIATAYSGWTFSSWSGDLTGSANPATITVTHNTEITATFTQNEYALTVNIVGSGSVTKDPNKATYTYGETVTLTASASVGYTFTGWSGDASGTDPSVTVIMNGNRAVTATFVQNAYTLTLTLVGNGSVTKVPDQASYHLGDVVQLTASASAGWSFSGWIGDFSSSVNPVSVIINGTTSITATFTQNMYSLTVTPVGSGSVNLNNSGPYYYGDVVELTVVPSTGWSFDHWSGDLSGSLNPTTTLIDDDKAVTATFTQNVYTLTVTAVGSGSVSLNNAGPHIYGDIVELTAIPDAGWSFDHWSGELGGSANPATILIDGNKAVTATFTQNTYILTISTVGSGSVNRDNTGPYRYGDFVELSAVPSIGWGFDHWSGDLTGSASPTTILIDGDKTVTATFTRNTYTLTVSTVGSGIVDLNNSGPYYYGDVVQLTAVPATGWSFSVWSGDLSGSVNPTTILIDGNKIVTATFTQNAFDFSVSAKPSSRSIATGSAATYTVTVSLLKGTSQSVSLSCSGLPSGAAASFSPTSGLPTFSSTLRITTTTSTPPGTYIITVTGSSQYISNWTTLQLKIMNFSVAPTPFSPNGDGAKDTTTVTSTFWDTLTWTLVVKNSTGFVIRQLGTGGGSSILIIWDGRDDTGVIAKDGTYTVSLSLPGLTKTGSVVVDTQLPTVTCSWSRSPFNPRSGQTSKLTYTLSEKCSIYIQIYDNAGKLVRTLLAPTTKKAGTFSVTWNGKDDSGVIVPSGTYTCKIFATDMAGNQASPYPTTCQITVS